MVGYDGSLNIKSGNTFETLYHALSFLPLLMGIMFLDTLLFFGSGSKRLDNTEGCQVSSVMSVVVST